MNLPKPTLANLHVSGASLTSDPRWRKMLLAAAVLLVIAIAIPVLLSKPGKPAALAALPPAPTVTTADVATNVTGSAPPAASQPRVTGAAHNPFLSTSTSKASKKAGSAGTNSTTVASASAGTPKASNAAGTSATAAAYGTSITSQHSASSTTLTLTQHAGVTKKTSATTHSDANKTTKQKSATPPASASHVVPVTTHTVTVVKTITKPAPYSLYQADIELHQQGVARSTSYARIARYQLLPADDGAFATFLGIRSDAKTAVFMLASGIGVSGNARCAPSVADCTFLTIEPGHSVTLRAPEWAGGKIFVLSYHSVAKVTASANVIEVDDSGRAVVRSAAGDLKALRSRTYGQFNGLLDMSIGRTLPAAL